MYLCGKVQTLHACRKILIWIDAAAAVFKYLAQRAKRVVNSFGKRESTGGLDSESENQKPTTAQMPQPKDVARTEP